MTEHASSALFLSLAHSPTRACPVSCSCLPSFFLPPSFPSPPSLSARRTLKLQVLLRCSSARGRCPSTAHTLPAYHPPACIQNELLHHPEGNYSAAPCIFLNAGHLRRYAAQALAIRLIPRRSTFFDPPHYCRLNKRHQSCCVVHARK